MMQSVLTRRGGWLLTGLTGAVLAGGALAAAGTAHASEPDAAPEPVTGIPNTSLTEAVTTALEERSECDATAAMYDDSNEPMWSVILECGDGAMRYVEVDAVTGDIKDNAGRPDTGGQDKKNTDSKKSKDSKKSDGSKSKDKDKDKDNKEDPNDAAGTGSNADKKTGSGSGGSTDKGSSDKRSGGNSGGSDSGATTDSGVADARR